jgi:hypothetical protein
MRLVITLCALLGFVATADAGKRAGVTLPDSYTVADKKLVLNGMGLREATWLKVDVYVAGLYVVQPTSSASKIISSNEPKMLVLRFVRNVDRSDIVKAWNTGFAENATVPLAKIQPYIDRLNAWMPKFREGDTLTFLYLPGQGVAVDINGVRKGVLAGEDFARSLFSIWLGPNPPTSALKRGLLGNHPEAEARR